jgi:RimJ/RimL family protein N-acetyltransferase
MRIECRGFTLRSYLASDVASLVRHADNPRVAENLRDRFPHPYTEDDAYEWLAVALKQDPETNFAIAVDGELVGTIGLEVGDDVYSHSAEIGYWLGEDYWGRGIATEAVRALTDWAFTSLGLLRVYALVFESNPASVRVLEKAGFALEGRMRSAVVKRGRVMDQMILSVVAPGD